MNVTPASYVAQKAPLSRLYDSDLEHARLIKRGFKSHYTGVFTYNGQNYNIQQLKFGHTDLIRENGDFDGGSTFIVNFALTGLPPATGTKVWLRLSSPAYNRPGNCSAFTNRNDALNTEIRNNDPFGSLIEDTDATAFAKALKAIEADGAVTHDGVVYAVVQVSLP